MRSEDNQSNIQFSNWKLAILLPAISSNSDSLCLIDLCTCAVRTILSCRHPSYYYSILESASLKYSNLLAIWSSSPISPHISISPNHVPGSLIYAIAVENCTDVLDRIIIRENLEMLKTAQGKIKNPFEDTPGL